MHPIKDKRARLRVAARYITMGVVKLPRTGCEQLLGQLLGFGVEKHDAVDALVYLIRRRNCATRNPLRLIKGAS